jgi:hypothetical protein
MKSRHFFTRRPCVEQLEGRLVPSVTSTFNWSGYAVTANRGTVTAVAGSWVVPSVTGTRTSYSAIWVGIDGWSSSTVEQVGTESDIVNGKAIYYAWYEMYPRASHDLALTVQPGDAITAQVIYTGGRFQLSLADLTSGQSYSTAQSMPNAERSSADWVVEAPSLGGIQPLADFTPVTFIGAHATITGTSHKPITGSITTSRPGTSVVQINMTNQFGASEDTTSTLTNGGTSFTVTRNPTGSSTTTPSSSNQGSNRRQIIVLVAAPAGLFPGLLTVSSPDVPALSPVMPQTPGANSASGAAAPGLPSAFSTGTIRLHQSTEAGSTDRGAAEQPAMPLVEPDVNEPGLPSDRSAPKPGREAFPMPPAAEAAFPSTLWRSSASAERDCDACFAQGRWTAAVVDSKTDTARPDNPEGALPIEVAAGVLLTVGVGSWAVAVERREERRRRLTVN